MASTGQPAGTNPSNHEEVGGAANPPPPQQRSRRRSTLASILYMESVKEKQVNYCF